MTLRKTALALIMAAPLVLAGCNKTDDTDLAGIHRAADSGADIALRVTFEIHAVLLIAHVHLRVSAK